MKGNVIETTLAAAIGKRNRPFVQKFVQSIVYRFL
jgi:hypothetical protein